jgi:hypothetical protein
MDEIMIEARVNEISEEYSQLLQLNDFNLTLEAIGEDGTVKATLTRGETVFEKTIAPDESLDFISDTFSYPDTITPRSKEISANDLKRVFFDTSGYLWTIRKGTEERFKVKDSHRAEVSEILRNRFGNKFKS